MHLPAIGFVELIDAELHHRTGRHMWIGDDNAVALKHVIGQRVQLVPDERSVIHLIGQAKR